VIARLSLTLALAMASVAAPAMANTETIRTKVPEANINAFMADCKRDVPDASCWCMVKKLASTRDGDFVLDIVTQSKMKGTEEQKKASALLVLNRHGLKPSEAQTILKTSLEPLMMGAAKACE
jgi:hypothetical protein